MPILNMVGGGKKGGNIGEPLNLTVTSSGADATITWEDNVIGTIPPTTFVKSELVRKIGSAPTSPSDGTLVVTETVKDTYKVSGYVDQGLTDGETYYYRVFSYSDLGGISYCNAESVTITTERPDITSATYDNKSVSVTAQGELQGVCFSTDGLNMYYCDYSAHYIRQYTLSTAWDVSTATSTSYYDVGSEVSGVAISNDGIYLFVSHGSFGVRKYTLSTPYDVSTASTTETLSIGSTNPTGISLKFDGTILYCMSYANSKIIEYSLPSAWTLTGATSVGNKSYPMSGNTYRDCAISFPGGKIFLTRQSSTSHIYQMDMSTNWDITTASYNSKEFTVSYNACGLYVKPDGSKMYLADMNSKAIKQYSLS